MSFKKGNEYRDYGLMKINQRYLKNDTFPVWTAIQECEGHSCVSAAICPYFYPETEHERKCVVQMKYLKEVEKMILENLAEDMDDFELFRIGMQIIPLYKQLARFKILEMSIGSSEIPEMTKSGTTKIHSLFKEIREVIKSIDAAWREIRVAKEKRPEVSNLIPTERGYYERMEKDALKEQQKLKIVKRG